MFSAASRHSLWCSKYGEKYKLLGVEIKLIYWNIQTLMTKPMYTQNSKTVVVSRGLS